MNKNLAVRILISFLGLILCGVGVSLFLYTGMGVDPASVLELGIGNVAGISYGSASAILNILILFLVFIVDRHYINISSFIAIFGIGYTADIVRSILDILIKSEPGIIMKIVMLIIGLVVMAIGIATYIRADLGVGAIDLVSEIISQKLRISYRLVRVIGDSSFVVIGYLLGGTVGVGTVLAVFMIGPVVQFVRPYVHKVLNRVLAH